MQNTIQAGQALSLIEKNIILELAGKELWGDIAVSEEEYKNLKDRIRQLLGNEAVDIVYLCKHYPCALTTFMIFLVRYEFNVNFWGLMSKELNVPIYGTIESEIGQCARSAFKKYGFDFSDVKDERRVNIEPILYEAGRPPESSLDDLFYLLKYDSYSVFDPQLIIEDLVEMRSYQIRKPMLRFLKRFKDERAVEFVLEVHDAMLAVDQNMSGDSHYIGNYTEWKERERTKESTSNRKKQEFQTKPYLSFENGKRGLCIILPRTIMRDEWVDDVEWHIVSNNGDHISKRMNVFGDEGRRYVDSITVPISPAAYYEVKLFDSENVEQGSIINWTIDGIRDNCVAFFNANGRMITPSYLPQPYGIMIYPDSVKKLESKNINLTYQSYPTNRTGYTVLAIEPIGSNASFSYFSSGITTTLNTRPQIDLYFEGKTLFQLPQDGKVRLFTELPDLVIQIDETALTNGLQLRLGKDNIDISDVFEQGKAVVSLKKYGKSLYSKYGTYSIRLYQYDHFLKQIEFCFVPKIKTNYSADIKWPDEADRKEKKLLRFEKKEDWQLEFLECVVNSDEANYIVECPMKKGSIRAVLKSTSEEDGFSYSFDLPITPFEFEILDSQGIPLDETTDRLKKIGLSDINSNEYWISFEFFGDYKTRSYKLRLRSANGTEQEEQLTLLQNGCGNFNMSIFYDTLNTCPLPAQIELYRDGNDDMALPILAIADMLEFADRPYYVSSGFVVLGINDENRDLTLRRFGADSTRISLSYESSRLGKQKISRGYPVPDKTLEEGIYVVDSSNQESAFVFEDEIGVIPTNGTSTMYVSTRGKDAEIESFSDWLDQLTRDIVYSGINGDIQTKKAFYYLKGVEKYENVELTSFDYERLVALAYFVNSKCIENKKNSIRICMRTISRYILNSKKRLEMIRLLAELECAQEIFDICLQEYNLLLFEMGAEDSKILAEKLENNSTELSMLLLMGIDESVWNTIRRDKYRELIGKEAIRSMLSVPDETDPIIIAEEQKKFLREYSPCKVKINLTSEISGDMEPIMKMIEVTHKSVVFNISKKPDFGLYFDRIKYVDQYVNWYTLNHDKDGALHEWKRVLMVQTVKDECANILDAVNNLSKGGSLGCMLRCYEEVLRARYQGDPMSGLNNNNTPRYFYLQGLAAFLAMLPAEYRKYGWAVRAGEHFMANAITIAPRIARRDLVMAATFIYLMRKEEKICQ